MTASQSRRDRLEYFDRLISQVILNRQHPISGLMPASTAVNIHGDYTDAWVRDNVYSILAAWGLALAYRKAGLEAGRGYEIQQSVVKLMRGLLSSMMRQAHKVERFKHTQDPLDALHAKYDTSTGNTVVADDGWGHLQIDATSVFLLILAQMTASGLEVIYTTDEVNFVQNLVYYIGRAYRTADYGIWERGNKINHGNPELNASSIGMAKAALEALNGFDLFGARGSQSSVLHVLEDEIARSRATLESLLPRESASKEVDGALLSIIGFPAFAVDDANLVDRTRRQIVEKLEGHYGCKRFLRDGHQTVLEDTSRLHYEPYELKRFEHIECEWPLFWTYLLLDALFRGDRDRALDYHHRLQGVAVEREGFALLPEVYYVPEEAIAAEQANPGSQTRLPNDNVPLVWAQSLWLLGQLVLEELIDVADLDPLGRRSRPGAVREPLVQMVLLSEDAALQHQLAIYGIETQTPDQVAPIEVRPARDLSAAYAQIGRNEALGLTGRPLRRLRTLTTSRIFSICGKTMVFLPSFLDQEQFYSGADPEFLTSQIRSELAYIARQWRQLGRPTMTLLLTREMLGSTEADLDTRSPLLSLIADFKAGKCNNVPIRLGRLQSFVLTAGSERIDFLHGYEFEQSVANGAPLPLSQYLAFSAADTKPLSSRQEFQLESETNPKSLLTRLRATVNLYEQIELIQDLWRLVGPDFETGFAGDDRAVPLNLLVEEIYNRALQGYSVVESDGIARRRPYWAIVRRAAGLLNKADINLSDAVTDLLVRQKFIAVGRAYSEGSLIDRPMPHDEIMAKIDEFCGEDIRDRVLSQEILVALGVLIKSNPALFKGFLTLRTSYFLLLLVSELGREMLVTPDEAYEQLMELSPYEVQLRLRHVLEGYQGATLALQQQESLHLRATGRAIEWTIVPQREEGLPPAGSWARQRELDGALNRVPKDFYPQVWNLLGHCKGLVIGDKLERRNRLDSALVLAEMTPGEKNFALQVEHLLNKIGAPLYRQVCMEALAELAALTDRNPELQIDDYLVLDVLVGHAVRLAWLDRHPQDEPIYNERKGQAWQQFYEASPYNCATFMVKAFQFLIEMAEQSARDRAEQAIDESLEPVG